MYCIYNICIVYVYCIYVLYLYSTSAEFQPLPGADYLDPYKILIPMAFSFVGILLIAIVVMVSPSSFLTN